MTSRAVRWLVVTGVVGLLFGGAPAALAGEGTVVQGELGRSLDRAVQRTTGGSFWGALLVARGGEPLLAKGYGFADYAERPNTPTTLFEIASTSKQFTAAAILRLVMQKKLRLDDTLDEHLPKVPEDKRGITIHHLLTHTSGMSPQTGVPYASTMSRREYLAYVLGEPLEDEPGSDFAYANAGYALLAAIVEEVSGRSFEAYVKKEVFKRAGLRDTGFVRDRSLDRKRVTSRLGDPRPEATAIDWHWGWGYRGMGGVVSTILDMLRWDRALRGEDVLDADAKAAFYEPYREGYALGWKAEATARGTTKLHHSGGVRGYAAQYARFLEEDVVVVILSNGKSDIRAVERAIEDLLFPKPVIRARLDWKGEALSRYKALMFEGSAAWTVAAAAGGVRLELRDARRSRTFATIELPRGPAEKLRRQLGAYLGARRAPPAGAKPGSDGGLYLGPYDVSAGTLDLETGLELELRPRYVGRGEGGERIVDERITFVLNDVSRRQWPVMVIMGDATARSLLADLGKALTR